MGALWALCGRRVVRRRWKTSVGVMNDRVLELGSTIHVATTSRKAEVASNLARPCCNISSSSSRPGRVKHPVVVCNIPL